MDNKHVQDGLDFILGLWKYFFRVFLPISPCDSSPEIHPGRLCSLLSIGHGPSFI